MRNLLVFVIATLGVVSAQENLAIPFVLDEDKPYVYLVFDHLGPRSPIEPGESPRGLWFKFVNNCRVPVTIGAFDPGTGEPGVGMVHEVVPIPVTGSAGISGSVRTPEATRTKPPEGYSPEVFSLIIVEPGESVLFSVPFTHLNPQWFIRVQFGIAVSKRRGDQPYSYVEFRWEQLPEGVRKQKK
jgi:hypothetical protein